MENFCKINVEIKPLQENVILVNRDLSTDFVYRLPHILFARKNMGLFGTTFGKVQKYTSNIMGGSWL